MTTATDAFADRARRLLRQAQADKRIPALSATVVRDGAPVLTEAVGYADPATQREATTSTPFRIGSITKTFTAVLVMQLRDAGRLHLDDPLHAHLAVPAHGHLTLRHLLGHLSGLQREPVGEVWDGRDMPDAARVLADVADAEAVLPAGQRWHYSNLAYALLGQVVAAVSGAPWEQVLSERLLGPLGLTSTGLQPVGEPARGFFVEPYTDTAVPQPAMDTAGVAPAGQLWSTSDDLGRWAGFLADPAPGVLAPATVREMALPQSMADLARWTLGFGLGLMLYRRDERILLGHGGAMPGFLAGLAVSPQDKVGAAVLTSAGAGADPEGLAAELVALLLDVAPAEPAVWAPAPEPPSSQVAELVGRWWSEGVEFVVRHRAGEVQLRAVEAPAHGIWTVLEPDGEDAWRARSGSGAGERLLVRRGPDGTPAGLAYQTYRFTREPRAF